MSAIFNSPKTSPLHRERTSSQYQRPSRLTLPSSTVFWLLDWLREDGGISDLREISPLPSPNFSFGNLTGREAEVSEKKETLPRDYQCEECGKTSTNEENVATGHFFCLENMKKFNGGKYRNLATEIKKSIAEEQKDPEAYRRAQELRRREQISHQEEEREAEKAKENTGGLRFIEKGILSIALAVAAAYFSTQMRLQNWL